VLEKDAQTQCGLGKKGAEVSDYIGLFIIRHMRAGFFNEEDDFKKKE